MQFSPATSVEDLRVTHRRLSYGPMVPRLWQVMRDEWQRRTDRLVAQSVSMLDHPGVAEDYRTASRFR